MAEDVIDDNQLTELKKLHINKGQLEEKRREKSKEIHRAR